MLAHTGVILGRRPFLRALLLTKNLESMVVLSISGGTHLTADDQLLLLHATAKGSRLNLVVCLPVGRGKAAQVEVPR